MISSRIPKQYRFLIAACTAMLIIHAFSMYTSAMPKVSQASLLGLPGRILLVLTVAAAIQNREQLKIVMLLAIGICMFSTAISYGKYVGVVPSSLFSIKEGDIISGRNVHTLSGLNVSFERSFGIFGLSGRYTIWMLIPTLFFLMSWVARKKNMFQMLISAGVGFAGISTVFFSVSRNFMLSTAAIFMLFVFETIRPKHISKAVILTLVILFMPLALWGLLALMEYVSQHRSQTVEQRLDQIHWVFYMLKQNPSYWLTGAGPSVFFVQHGLDVHNTPLLVLIEYGLIMTIIYMSLWLLRLWHLYLNVGTHSQYCRNITYLAITVLASMMAFPALLLHECWVILGILYSGALSDQRIMQDEYHLEQMNQT